MLTKTWTRNESKIKLRPGNEVGERKMDEYALTGLRKRAMLLGTLQGRSDQN